jgi:hypothetical protein
MSSQLHMYARIPIQYALSIEWRTSKKRQLIYTSPVTRAKTD